MPLAAPAEPRSKIEGEEITVTIGPRTYRVLDWRRTRSRGVMRVNVQGLRPERARRVLVSRRHAGHGELPAARDVHQAGRARTGAKEETIHAEVGKLWAVLGDLQREQHQKDTGAASGRDHHERRGASGGDGVAARSAFAGACAFRLRQMRRGGRGDEQAR